MGQTRKASKVICYTGINSKKSGVHTEAEFLKITRKWAKNKDRCNRMLNGKYVCPKDGNVKGWMKWFGAETMDKKKCLKVAKDVQKSFSKFMTISKKEEKALKAQVECAKQECADEITAVQQESNRIIKQARKCPKEKYIDCFVKLYKKSKGLKLTKKATECEQTKCAKTYKRLKNIRGF